MNNRKLINILCLSGIISVVFYILHDIVGTINYPGYNPLSMAVSDLTAKDAPSYVIAHGFINIYSIFNCLCCTLVCILIEDESNKLFRCGIYSFSIMNFISAIGYALFPLSSTGFDGSIESIIHVYVITTIVVLLSVISLVLIALGSLKGKNKHKLLGYASIVSLVLMFIGTILSMIIPKSYFGVVERLSTYSAVIFTAVLGLYGFRKNN